MTRKSDIGRYAIVPEWLVRSGASGTAIKVFVVLALHANRNTDQGWPSRQQIARTIGASVRTVARAIDELEQVHAVVVKQRRVPGTQELTSSCYTVLYSAPGGVTNGLTGEDARGPTGGDKYGPVTRTKVN